MYRYRILVIGLVFAFSPARPVQAQFDDLRLAAWMHGDSISGGGTQLTVRSLLDPLAKPVPTADVPTGGGTARLRIADNNKALPQNRIYFNYNHFHNAFMVEPGANSNLPSQNFSVDRYTIGFEKTLFSDSFSVEVRAPVTGTYEFFSPEFGVRGSNAGNISVITKRLLTQSETGSSVVGLGINLPTGTDIVGNFSNIGYTIQNETVHLVPYLGLLAAPNDLSFFHTFLSTDIPTNGNPIIASGIGQDNLQLGTLTAQTLFAVDVGAGVWLYRYASAPMLTGVASLLELHYTTTSQDADKIAGVFDTTLLEFGNSRNRSDTLNLTVAMHFEFGIDTSLRVGSAFPLRDAPDRDFDAELLVQLVHKFGASQSRSRSKRSQSSRSTRSSSAHPSGSSRQPTPHDPYRDVSTPSVTPGM